MRHGVSTISGGSRTALGVIFHDAGQGSAAPSPIAPN
jgi:hypothetical protein